MNRLQHLESLEVLSIRTMQSKLQKTDFDLFETLGQKYKQAAMGMVTSPIRGERSQENVQTRAESR